MLDAAAAAKMLDRPKDWTEVAFTPTPVQIAGALAFVALGFVATLGVARLGRGSSGEAMRLERGAREFGRRIAVGCAWRRNRAPKAAFG